MSICLFYSLFGVVFFFLFFFLFTVEGDIRVFNSLLDIGSHTFILALLI